MTRALAFLLALAVTLGLMAAAIVGIDWLMTRLPHLAILDGRGVALATGSFVAVWLPLAVAVWLPLAARKRAAGKKDEDGRLTPLVRRNPATGLREL